jgi:hypothetical protein
VNTSHLFFGGWLWGGLLISSCAYISPALGSQGVSSVSSVKIATHTSALTTSSSLNSSRNLSSAQITPPSVPSSNPTFWASQSLARLMDQHDCPPQSAETEALSIDSGLRQVNRYKIAAQLFSCLEHWDQQAFDTQEQAMLEALRSEFKLELVALQDYSAPDPVLISANIQSESIGSNWSPQTSDFVVNIPINTIKYKYSDKYSEHRQSIDIASQGQVAMGVHYIDRALGAPRTLLGINAEASLGKIGLFGRYGTALGPKFSQANRNFDNPAGDRSIQSWTAGIDIRDFIVQHSVLTISVNKSIQPSNFTQSVQTNYGAFYQFPLTQRLTLSPSIVIMTHSEKAGAAPDVQGALQASFSF